MFSKNKPGFDCSCCGDCCSGDMDIFVNIYDLYKISNFLGLKNSKELFNSGLFTLEKGQNNMICPKIKFKTQPYKFCPFLTNSVDEDFKLKGYCKLHPYHKPLVCILAPISRELNLKKSISSFFITYPSNHCNGRIYNEEDYIELTCQNLNKELQYEERYFRILDSIKSKGIKGYEKIYYFDMNSKIEDIITNIESFTC